MRYVHKAGLFIESQMAEFDTISPKLWTWTYYLINGKLEKWRPLVCRMVIFGRFIISWCLLQAVYVQHREGKTLKCIASGLLLSCCFELWYQTTKKAIVNTCAFQKVSSFTHLGTVITSAHTPKDHLALPESQRIHALVYWLKWLNRRNQRHFYFVAFRLSRKEKLRCM